MSDSVLNVHLAPNGYGHIPVAEITLGRRSSDPLTPYITKRESARGDTAYRPGGRRYTTAGLVLPALHIQHTNGLVLEFDSLEAVDATMDYLMKVRGLLLETLTEEDIQQDDEADRF